MGCFRKAVGVSAVEYISQLRIQLTCEQLEKTREPVVTIAFNCGYSNLSNFNRQFKRKVRCTPQEYRNARIDKN